jgi:hypothetical protein
MINKIFEFKKRAALMMLLLLVALTLPLFGQVPIDTTGVADGPFPDGVTLPGMLNLHQVIFGALTILWGFVAKPLGLKGDKVPFIFVVLAGAAVLAIVAVSFGFGSLWQYIFPFLSAIGIYDLLFKGGKKLIEATPKE